MTTVIVEFDGSTFVPQQPVELPVGTRVAVTIPDATSECITRPATNPDVDLEWNDIVSQIRSVEPDPSTVEETMRQIRMRP